MPYVEDMRKGVFIVVFLLLAFLPPGGVAQETNVEPMLSTQPEEGQAGSRVTSVYGVTVDDYLPGKEVARQHLRPNMRRNASHPAFDLPDAFYFIGGPIFLLLLLRVLVIFLNGFEEKRMEEQRSAASENINPE